MKKQYEANVSTIRLNDIKNCNVDTTWINRLDCKASTDRLLLYMYDRRRHITRYDRIIGGYFFANKLIYLRHAPVAIHKKAPEKDTISFIDYALPYLRVLVMIEPSTKASANEQNIFKTLVLKLKDQNYTVVTLSGQEILDSSFVSKLEFLTK